MNWHFCIDSTEKRALDLCRGSMNKGDGFGRGNGGGRGYGYGNGYGCSGGYGSGYGYTGGYGSSPQVWR